MTNKDSLMLGDWVLNTKNGKPAQIGSLDWGTVGVQMGDIADYIPYSCIEPIPITPEFLKRNGFLMREGVIIVPGSRLVRELDEGRTEITIWLRDESMLMEVRKNIYYEDEICYTLPSPFFVHELQHCLRFTRIEMEIEL